MHEDGIGVEGIRWLGLYQPYPLHTEDRRSKLRRRGFTVIGGNYSNRNQEVQTRRKPPNFVEVYIYMQYRCLCYLNIIYLMLCLWRHSRCFTARGSWIKFQSGVFLSRFRVFSTCTRRYPCVLRLHHTSKDMY